MSYSPPIRRLSSASNQSSESIRHQEELINAYEAEEERIINVLGRKLEQLRQEKIGLENALEAESEAHVNKLSREISSLRLAQQQLQQQQAANDDPSPVPGPSTSSIGFRSFMHGTGPGRGNPGNPSTEELLETLRRENENVRSKLAKTEQEFIRISRLNDIYREELIEHRRRLGIPIDNLIGMAPDPLSQPTHQRYPSSGPSSAVHIPHSNAIPFRSSSSHFASSSISSPSSSHPQGVPIPRSSVASQRPVSFKAFESSGLNTPLSHSPFSPGGDSETFPFSPGVSLPGTSSSSAGLGNTATASSTPISTLDDSDDYAASPSLQSHRSSGSSYYPSSSGSTNVTSPPSSFALAAATAQGMSSAQLQLNLGRGLTYPSVPPPSLSSSFGSPTVSYIREGRAESTSPVESRRNSNAWRFSSPGSASHSRRASLDYGARVAETGSLVRGGRSRANSAASGGLGSAAGVGVSVLEATMEVLGESESGQSVGEPSGAGAGQEREGRKASKQTSS